MNTSGGVTEIGSSFRSTFCICCKNCKVNGKGQAYRKGKELGRLMQFIITQYPRLINIVPKRTRVSNVLCYGRGEYDILLVMNNTYHTFVCFSTPFTEKLYGFYF